MRKIGFGIAALLSLALSGCAVEPVGDAATEITNTTKIPTAWMFASANEAQQSHENWWQNFNDATLNQLIDQALAHNQDLAAAGFTLKQAEVAIRQARINQTPTADGNASGSRQRDFNAHQSTNNFSTSLNASYTLDLWRKLATQTDVARWTAEATAQDLLATRLNLVGNVANAYFKWLYTRDELTLNAAQTRYQQQTLDLVQTQFSAGSASMLDVTSAQRTLTELENTRNQLLSEHLQAENDLSVLLGQPPAKLIAETAPLATIALPEIPAGLPASILHQRPDLRAAQYRLQADLGNISVDELSFYPTITLTGALSTGSTQLAEILRNPLGSLAASITLPFLNYRENKLTVEASKYQYQADLATFRQTLYAAFGDVEDALLALQESDQSESLLRQELAQAERIQSLRRIRYQTGADDLQYLLDAEQSVRDVQSSLLQNRYNQLTRRVALYLALGGNARVS